MITVRKIDSAARKLVELLSRSGKKLVLAESCTGGLIAATLTKIPGVSEHLCGSAVTYQLETKTAWLEIPESVVKRDDAVTRDVAELMAIQVLAKTPQADVAAAVTGHLGPNVPAKLDGVVFVAVAVRTGPKSSKPKVRCKKYRFADPQTSARQPAPDRTAARKLRLKRQRLAVFQALSDTAAVVRATSR
jgi:PncC family amidohydrolase